MWIQKRGNKYRFMERYIDPITGKQQYVTCTLEKDTPQYQRRASAILQDKITEKLQASAAPDKITLQTLMDKYAKYQSVTVKETTAVRNSYQAAAVGRILGGQSIVSSLTAAYVTDKLISAGETPACTNGRIKYLKACIRWGYKMDLVESPALADKISYLPDPGRKEKLMTKFMEPEELQKLLDSMDNNRWKLLTRFLCLSGLRIGELIALTDKDVGDKYIHVSKTYDVKLDKLHDTPKTDTSNRDVYIQKELADCIKEMRKERRIMLLAAGASSHLFYPDAKGGYLHYSAFNKYLAENSLRVLGRKLTSHACRHTMTSIFAAQGASIDTISRRLGHSDSKITKEIYLHVTGEQRKKDEAQIDNIRVLSS